MFLVPPQNSSINYFQIGEEGEEIVPDRTFNLAFDAGT
jgi:hypothetical protein